MEENAISTHNTNKFMRFTAIFCIITAILTMIFCIGSKPFYMKDELNELKKERIEANDKLKELTKKQEDLNRDYANFKSKAEPTIEEYTDALNEAEKKLNKLCHRDSFSSSYYSMCADCDYKCKSLHEAVEDAEEQYYKNVSKLNDKLESYEADIQDVKKEISSIQKKLEKLEPQISELQGEYGKALCKFFGVLVVCAAIFVFAVYMLKNRESYRLGIIACGAGALGSLLLTFAGKGNMIFIPHIWSIVIFAVFAFILYEENEMSENVSKFVACRVVAIVAAVLAFLSSIGSFTALFVAPLYAAAMILVSFVLIPLDFKEYIKVSKHILLSVITLGIWLLVWLYHVTKNLNKVESLENRNPLHELLLCMFLPFYFAYWLYKNAEYVEAYGDEKGKPVNKISILCFIIGFFCPIMSTILMQDKINQIVGKPE